MRNCLEDSDGVPDVHPFLGPLQTGLQSYVEVLVPLIVRISEKRVLNKARWVAFFVECCRKA
jgi:hypothetical protein